MSLTTIGTAGLKNATTGQKVDCAKEQLVSGAKNAVLAAGTGLLGGAAMTGVLKNDTFSKTLAKGFDKIVTPGLKNSIKTVFERFVETAKNNPSATKAIAMIAVPASIIGSFLGVKTITDSARIQGKHQERADHINKN